MLSHSLRPTVRTRRLLLLGLCLAGLIAGGTAPAAARSTSPLFFALASTNQISDAYTPAQIATAYDFSPFYSRGMQGSGQKIALIELGGVNASDLNTFDAEYGLPAVHITQHYVGGQTFTISSDPEATLDVEWAHALAPQARILLFYVNSRLSNRAGWIAMGKAISSAVSHGAGQVGISLGACDAGAGYQTFSSALAAAEAKGVSVFVASGDDGDLPGPRRQCGSTPAVSYPAADPSVVAVGGTSVELSQDGNILSETAWDLSGGGIAALLRPSWQTAPTLPSGSQRWAPDVSFLADPQTGVQVFYRGRWHQTGGTSVGAPAWAAAWSLIREDAQQAGKTVGAAEPLIYRIGNSSAYASAFHDIVSGSNGKYQAGPGWDPVTGWGTPDLANLDTAVQALAQ
jgi:kumamolisin